jgi:hypothetical protein
MMLAKTFRALREIDLGQALARHWPQGADGLCFA